MQIPILRASRRLRFRSQYLANYSHHVRPISTDSRNRLSKFWAPTGGTSSQDVEQDDSNSLLLQGGFLRQAHSGVFHLLPLGLRVQNKLEALIDKHMQSMGASKTSLSSITTEALWKQSGRYSANSELLRVNDRRKSGFLLSPTHEEEITALVADIVYSYKDLPVRLYQIGRKYRDERRPRQGLLRAKEFMMKDLYTFDASADAALKTYEEVRQAYTNIFDELKLPYLVADADSGNMGGKLSHEYHFVSPKGEDNVWSCNSCSYVANEELVEKGSNEKASTLQGKDLTFTGISTDHKTIINISIHRPHSISESEEISWDRINDFINLHAVKRLLPPNCTLDTGIEASTLSSLLTSLSSTLKTIHITASNTTTNLTTILPNDPCPHCPSGTLSVQRAIEVAHTFHLGTRYSEPLNALIAMPDTANSNNTTKQAMQMGCHGIGVSRLIGVIASLLSDTKGLNWPRVIAPYEVAVIPGGQVSKEEGEGIYDLLSGLEERGGRGRLREGDVDVVLDDREGRSLGWKLKDADLIGYPVIVVLGRDWKEGRKVEVQCRRLGVKSVVEVAEVKGVVEGLLDQL